MRLVPWVQVLPSAGQVRGADAGRQARARAQGEVGLGQGAPGWSLQLRVPQFGVKGSAGSCGQAVRAKQSQEIKIEYSSIA